MTTFNPSLDIDGTTKRYSDALVAIIQQQIQAAGGKITFADYMQLCLYQEEFGYYTNNSEIFGPSGDFTTAPEISPLFAQTLANHIKDASASISSYDLLEFGAGSGAMAIELLSTLAQKEALPQHYYIIEASAHLRAIQKQKIIKALPEFHDKVQWLDHLPDNFHGVIIANEVCDAMPFHRLYFDKQHCYECYVGLEKATFSWQLGELSQIELKERAELIRSIHKTEDYYTEVGLLAEAWVASLADCFQQGAIFIIDYGYHRHSFYHPQRHRGTLMCYHRHQGHDNPLILPGTQDITSHIDFTALAESANTVGFDVEGFQSQADFLLAGGIVEQLELAQRELEPLDYLKYTSAVKRFTLPSAMGESFMALTITKNLDHLLPRLQLGDQRHRL